MTHSETTLFTSRSWDTPHDEGASRRTRASFLRLSFSLSFYIVLLLYHTKSSGRFPGNVVIASSLNLLFLSFYLSFFILRKSPPAEIPCILVQRVRVHACVRTEGELVGSVVYVHWSDHRLVR